MKRIKQKFVCLAALLLGVSLVGMTADGEAARQVLDARSRSTAELISPEEEQGIYQKFQQTPEIPLRFINPDDAKVVIRDARVIAARRESRYLNATDAVTAYATDYVMQVRLTMANHATEKVTGVMLKFTNPQSERLAFVSRQILEVLPAASRQLSIPLMAVPGNPASLRVAVVGVNFGDPTAWQEFPALASPMLNPRQPENQPVDVKPRPLNHLPPNYTERARRNRVAGVVRLFVGVGKDGMVTKVEVINALPDGLTEEAIKIARVLQFKPAIVAGAAVAYTVPLDVEFNLR